MHNLWYATRKLHRLTMNTQKTLIFIYFFLLLSNNSIYGATNSISEKITNSDQQSAESITSKNQNSGTTEKIPVLFSHGFGGSKLRCLLYAKGYEKTVSFLYQQKKVTLQNYLFDRQLHQLYTFNYHDVQVDMGIYGSIPDPTTAEVAQADDINTLHAYLEKIPEQKLIGFGYSRGAATWLTMLGTTTTSKTIAALILESPFAIMQNVAVYNIVSYAVACANVLIPSVDLITTSNTIFNSIFQNYNLAGIQPINVAHLIDKNIPIMLVHSQQDTIIPINDSRNLYLKLKEAGHQHVYLVELKQGVHAALLWGPEGELYRNVVHAFYKKYGLPHQPDFAQNIDLAVYQPSIQEVQQRIGKQQKNVTDIQKGKESFSTSFNIFV